MLSPVAVTSAQAAINPSFFRSLNFFCIFADRHRLMNSTNKTELSSGKQRLSLQVNLQYLLREHRHKDWNFDGPLTINQIITWKQQYRWELTATVLPIHTSWFSVFKFSGQWPTTMGQCCFCSLVNHFITLPCKGHEEKLKKNNKNSTLVASYTWTINFRWFHNLTLL